MHMQNFESSKFISKQCRSVCSLLRTRQAMPLWQQAKEAIDLTLFVVTGVGIAQSFEILQVHAGPARYETFLLAWLGYTAQCVVGGVAVASSGAWRHCGSSARWTRGMVAAIVGSAVLDGCAQAINYVAQLQGGIMLFTIFQSSVTLFVCLIAVCVLGTRLAPLQWLGVSCIVLGLLLTSLPSPVVARRSFSVGVACSMLGSLFSAASYPVSELVFRLAPPGAPPAEELVCLLGSLLNAAVFTAWTLFYTLPRWDEAVLAPMRASLQPSAAWALAGYGLFALFVGLHALFFWRSVGRLGSVPTAVSRGVQQAGTFVCAHVFFCRVDPTECLWNNARGDRTDPPSLWSRWQKPAALASCCVGVAMFTIGRARHRQSRSREGHVKLDAAALRTAASSTAFEADI